MSVSLSECAESKAKQAESLPAFGGINLLHIKRQIASLLSLIGRQEIFDEYTRHDISHINEMLRILEWLIPADTRSCMSSADWLFIVLAVYFHDLGMLVTEREYARRQESGFVHFRNDVLFANTEGKDYGARVRSLPEDKVERFLYQEFVRDTHSQRIRSWILGTSSNHLGVAHEALREVDQLLQPLGTQARRDLALVCESHHLDDLDVLSKYKPSQPYGNSDAETANLQYAAILLRSADLLHITSDRTPSIVFRTINPNDPISQQEWAKQMAVKRVRPKLGLNREGIPDENAPKNTIEIHAYFSSANGFFGLTSYLAYAQKQLMKCRDWAATTNRMNLAPHKFPWAWIDDSNIETEGFIRETFEFQLDQARILDLLTGHTLYNDSRVVLRELIQNSLDAIRLQRLIDHGETVGRIAVHWNSTEHILSIQDNGTGMTQSIVTNFLLRVGSSRYQDPQFKKDHPNFSPISRFGIGVLSTFMIADTVEIITCHPDDPEARQLSLRSVHGKYLIRLLDKATAPAISSIAPHGTLVRLTIRPSAEVPDVIAATKRWVVLPCCEVMVTVDQQEPIQIGFESPKSALEAHIRSSNLGILESDLSEQERHIAPSSIRVIERNLDGLSLAYAVRWNAWFREWNLLQAEDQSDSNEPLPVGTCIEGMRVEFNTPGYTTNTVLALANAYGPYAPRTNVVRSGLENTAELDNLLKKIYIIFIDHIAQELQNLYIRRNFSVTWAAQEASYLLSPLFTPSRHKQISPDKPLTMKENIFLEAIKNLGFILVEDHKNRRLASIAELQAEKKFWTIDCALLQSAEMLLREISTNSSLSALMETLAGESVAIPNEPIVCYRPSNDSAMKMLFMNREVDLLKIDREHRRVDLRWVEMSDPPRWFETPSHYSPFDRNLLVGAHDIMLEPTSDEIAVTALGKTYLLPDSLPALYLGPLIQKMNHSRNEDDLYACAFVTTVINSLIAVGQETIANPEDKVTEIMDRVSENLRRRSSFMRGMQGVPSTLNLASLYELIAKTKWRSFNPADWKRRDI